MFQVLNNHEFREGRLRVYIDECQLIFNAREWNITGRKEWLSFFTQHRKYGYDIYLIAQFDRMIDRQIRSLIEYEVIHRKASNFGTMGTLFSLFTGGNLFVAVTMWYPMKEKIESQFFKANRKYYSLYDTYNTFGSDTDKTSILDPCNGSKMEVRPSARPSTQLT